MTRNAVEAVDSRWNLAYGDRDGFDGQSWPQAAFPA